MRKGAPGSNRCAPSSFGGAEGDRTPDPKTASLVLSQLSYSPTCARKILGGWIDRQGGYGNITKRIRRSAFPCVSRAK